MKRWILIALAALAAGMFHPAGAPAAAEAARMDKQTLRARLGSPEVVIIDVRAATDWLLTSDKIKGAERQNPRQFDEWAGKYGKDKTIVLYCA